MLEKQQYPPISVVVPTRNEAQNLHYLLSRMPSFVSEVILVDGHSTDDTIAVAQQLRPTIRIIKQIGRGKGDAVRLGFATCTGDIIVMLDGDGSTDPYEIERFVDALMAGNDFAKGSRFVDGGDSQDITPLRRLGNHGLCQLVNWLFHVRFSDLCYGYNAFWRYCLDCIEIESNGFEVETQISLRMCKAGLKIIEVPSTEHPRLYGQSHLRTFRDGWRVLKTIVEERGISAVTPAKADLSYPSLNHAETDLSYASLTPAETDLSFPPLIPAGTDLSHPPAPGAVSRTQ
jgi:glycosyltransferase involved in cell wall biosynthesis